MKFNRNQTIESIIRNTFSLTEIQAVLVEGVVLGMVHSNNIIAEQTKKAEREKTK